MSVKIKNIVIVGMITMIIVPFILISDIFPFMRFGMFAEPVKKEIQKEVFEVSFIDQSNKETTLNPKSIGIEPHIFSYLARNYYYRRESEKFLNNISKISTNKTVVEWRMKKINQKDTSVVSKMIVHEQK